MALAAGAVSMAVIDFLWLGIIMRDWIYSKIGASLNLVNGSLVVNTNAVILFYIVAAFSIYAFVIPRVSTVSEAFLTGALFGGLMYAFYDLTNMATLKYWSWQFAAVDIAWGAFLMGITSVIIFYILK